MNELIGSMVSIHPGDNEEVVGVVDVPGCIEVGDRVVVRVYEPPSR